MGPEQVDGITQPESADAGMGRRDALRRMLAGATALILAGKSVACDDPREDQEKTTDEEPYPGYEECAPLKYLVLFTHQQGFIAEFENATGRPVSVVVFDDKNNAFADFEIPSRPGEDQNHVIPFPPEGTNVLYISIDGNEAVPYRVTLDPV